MDSSKEENAWREVKHSQRFLHAFRGLYVFSKTTRHLYFHLLISALVVLSGFYFKISNTEWMMLVFAIGLVLISEVFNTAIEIDINLTSPEYHPYARDTKDVAAGAVLLSAFVAIIIGLIIFFPIFLTVLLPIFLI